MKTLTIIILAAWNITQYLPTPPEPDMILGVFAGLLCGVVVVVAMALMASQAQTHPQPVQVRRKATKRQPVRKASRTIATSVYGFQPAEVFA